MINRENYKARRAYLTYLTEVRQLDDKTVGNAHGLLRNTLEWADETPLAKSAARRPTLPHYLAERLAPSSVAGVLGETRRFFRWLRMAQPRKFQHLTDLYISTLVPPRAVTGEHDHIYYTLEEMLKLVAVPVERLIDRRDQAAAALLFLSGVRVTAFVTLPINCVLLKDDEIRQWPEKGVQTKFDQRATTFLLSVPELLAPVRSWDAVVRAELPGDAPWYAALTPEGTALNPRWRRSSNRRALVECGLRRLCARAGVDYKAPHKLRHGFAMYGLDAAETIADMEAVSKNLGHSSLEVTMRTYAVLGRAEVKSRIVRLGRKT